MTSCWAQWAVSVLLSPLLLVVAAVVVLFLASGAVLVLRRLGNWLPVPPAPPAPVLAWWDQHGWQILLFLLSLPPVMITAIALHQSIWGCETCNPTWLPCDARDEATP